MAVCQTYLNGFILPGSMLALSLITGIPLLLYAILICRYTYRWNTYREYEPGQVENPPCFSVIVSFRNEENNLPVILNDLSLQDYPPEKFEVILINDHSDDQSLLVARDFCKHHETFRVVLLPNDKAGKKEALHAGISAARHEIIVTTDADCRAGRQWLSTLASFYEDFSPALIIGLVVPPSGEKGFFSYFQNLESISLTGAGAASAIDRRPIYCSGANLCYRKELYYRYSDPMLQSVISGDDTFLLLQMKKQFRSDIRILKSKHALIRTKSETNPAGFIRQRSRWISKSIHYRDRDILLSALVVFFANLMTAISVLFLFFGFPPWVFPVLLAMKFLPDGIFLWHLSRYFGLPFRLFHYAVSAVIYPLYLMISMTRAFLFPVEWKGRRHRR
jgi:cellulose synthase/poly-beta-1,6-N-acetylglucosamine synthase-like glycosyltransferase